MNDETSAEAVGAAADEAKTNVENDVKAEVSAAHAELATASQSLLQKIEAFFAEIPAEIRAEYEALKAKL